MKTKMTKAEKNWVLYDVGNSAFVLLVSTIMPIYFNYLAGNAGLSSVNYLAYWGYAVSVSIGGNDYRSIAWTGVWNIGGYKRLEETYFHGDDADWRNWLSGAWIRQTMDDISAYLYYC